METLCYSLWIVHWTSVLNALSSGCNDKWIGQRKRREGHSEISLRNILSVTLSPPPSSLHRLGLLWLFGYSAFSPWPITNKYKLLNLYRGLSYDYLHHFLFLILHSHGVGQTKTSTSPCIQGVIYEVLTVWRERKFYPEQLSAPSTGKVS